MAVFWNASQQASAVRSALVHVVAERGFDRFMPHKLPQLGRHDPGGLSLPEGSPQIVGRRIFHLFRILGIDVDVLSPRLRRKDTSAAGRQESSSDGWPGAQKSEGQWHVRMRVTGDDRSIGCSSGPFAAPPSIGQIVLLDRCPLAKVSFTGL